MPRMLCVASSCGRCALAPAFLDKLEVLDALLDFFAFTHRTSSPRAHHETDTSANEDPRMKAYEIARSHQKLPPSNSWEEGRVRAVAPHETATEPAARLRERIRNGSKEIAKSWPV